MENVKANQIETVTKLVKRVKKGDNKAFQLLYDNTWKPAYYSLLKKTGNKTDAEILLNEVYVTVFVGIKKLRDETAFYSWLMKVTDHTYLRFLHKNKKTETEESYEEQEQVKWEAEQDEEFIPDIALENKEHRTEIIKTINVLPEKQREAIYMFYYLNMKVREIAETTETTESTVLKRLHDGRKSLKNKLKTLIEKGVVVYNMAGFWVLRELFKEDMSNCIDREIGPTVWAKLVQNTEVIAVQKAAKALAAKMFAAKLTAGATTIGLVGLYFFQNTGTNEQPNLHVVAVDEQGLIKNETNGRSQMVILEEIKSPPAPQSPVNDIETIATDEALEEIIATGSINENESINEVEVIEEERPGELANLDLENTPLQEEPQDDIVPPVPTPVPTPLPTPTPVATPQPQISESGGIKTSSDAPVIKDISMELELAYEINEAPDAAEIINEIAFYSGGAFDPKGDEVTVSTNSYNREALGEYKLELLAVKGTGETVDIKTRIRVTDKIIPVITVANPRLSFKSGENVTLEEIIAQSGVAVTDNSGEDITPTVTGYERIDFVLGSGREYVLIINATDSQGNMALQKHVFVVVE